MAYEDFVSEDDKRDAKLCRARAFTLKNRAANYEGLCPARAKRYREAAFHADVMASIFDGSRTFATEAELAETRAKYGAGEGVDRG